MKKEMDRTEAELYAARIAAYAERLMWGYSPAEVQTDMDLNKEDEA